MKHLLRFAALIGLFALLPSAYAKDATGTWKGSFDFQGTMVPLVIHLNSAAGVVTGTIDGFQTASTEIHDGKANGDRVTFWVNTDYQGTIYKLLFTGKIGDGQIDFSFGTEGGEWATQMTVKNSAMPTSTTSAASDVSGTWKGAFDFQGTPVPLVFHFTSKEGAVTGTIEGLPNTPTEIHEGKVDGDTITFWANSDYQGTTYKIVYKGKISADGIKFTLGTEDGSWGSDLVATKSL